jgi:hypothetical protein
MARTPEELEEALRTQVRFLFRSCEAFDAGDKNEALRIATAVVTLVHDRGQTISLFTQADLKTKHKFFSTAGELMNEARQLNARHTPLVRLDYASGNFLSLGVYGRLHMQVPPMKETDFADWWEESIFRDDGVELSRKKLSLILRDKEGGSHYDPSNNNPDYHSLSSKLLMHVPGHGLGTVDELQFSTMRQIGDEILMTANFPKWLTLYERK